MSSEHDKRKQSDKSAVERLVLWLRGEIVVHVYREEKARAVEGQLEKMADKTRALKNGLELAVGGLIIAVGFAAWALFIH